MSRIIKFFKRPPKDPFVDEDVGPPPSPFEYWWTSKKANWEMEREIKEDNKRRLERSQSVIARPERGSKIVKKPSP